MRTYVIDNAIESPLFDDNEVVVMLNKILNIRAAVHELTVVANSIPLLRVDLERFNMAKNYIWNVLIHEKINEHQYNDYGVLLRPLIAMINTICLQCSIESELRQEVRSEMLNVIHNLQYTLLSTLEMNISHGNLTRFQLLTKKNTVEEVGLTFDEEFELEYDELQKYLTPIAVEDILVDSALQSSDSNSSNNMAPARFT